MTRRSRDKPSSANTSLELPQLPLPSQDHRLRRRSNVDLVILSWRAAIEAPASTATSTSPSHAYGTVPSLLGAIEEEEWQHEYYSETDTTDESSQWNVPFVPLSVIWEKDEWEMDEDVDDADDTGGSGCTACSDTHARKTGYTKAVTSSTASQVSPQVSLPHHHSTGTVSMPLLGTHNRTPPSALTLATVLPRIEAYAEQAPPSHPGRSEHPPPATVADPESPRSSSTSGSLRRVPGARNLRDRARMLRDE